jgi:hypothetical protein
MLEDSSLWPAGVAYTHPTMGYQTVNLGFGMEFMIGDLLPNGHYVTGAYDRVDLMGNIMEYFGETPTATPTGVDEGTLFANELGLAHPNPFNPETSIGYSVAAAGPVTIRVYDVAGRLVRTLVDSQVAPGRRRIAWNGLTDGGGRAASGVYFVRMEVPSANGFSATRKLVLLK